MEIETLPSSEQIKEDVQHLKEWFSKEPHLPNIDDEEWLTTFLYNNKFSLEKTKFKLERYYTFRSKYPQILKNRDPIAQEILQAKKALGFCVSDRFTKDGSRVIFFRYNPDANIFNNDDVLKRVFMIMDMLILEKDRLTTYHNVTDFKDANVQHLLKILSGVKMASEVFNKAYTERMKGIHLLNLPPFADKIISAIKMYFPKKIVDRMHIHHSTESLFEKVDEDVVCSDFGGSGPCYADYDSKTQRLLETYSQWFKDQDSVCSNEEFRPNGEPELDDLKGSFRRLDVD